MNRIKELEAENEDLRKRLQDAYYLIGMKPENMFAPINMVAIITTI